MTALGDISFLVGGCGQKISTQKQMRKIQSGPKLREKAITYDSWSPYDSVLIGFPGPQASRSDVVVELDGPVQG